MFTRYEGAAWEDRFLPRLSSREVEALDKEEALVILPIGAIEQHGPHMPVMTDALIGEAVLTETMEMLPSDLNVWMLPPIAYGKSNEHLDFAGTISLSASTLQSIIIDIAKSLKNSGFRRLLLFNTHGGNVDLLNVAAREIRILTDLMVFYISPGSFGSVADLITEEEQEFGIHAGDVETSMLMAIKPNWVHEDFLVSQFPKVQDYKFLTMEGKIRFAWVMSDISAYGVAGDATAATSEKGETIMRRTSEVLVEALKEICKFEISQVRAEKKTEK